eukprot:13896071-Alexandrium_andersonii.AAC.1
MEEELLDLELDSKPEAAAATRASGAPPAVADPPAGPPPAKMRRTGQAGKYKDMDGQRWCKACGRWQGIEDFSSKDS